jgi:hypothetical protein
VDSRVKLVRANGLE